jgi:hypothetical protein
MALQAKRTHIGEIALPAALRDRHDVIRIPERFPAALDKSPLLKKFPPGCEIKTSHIAAQRNRVHAALRANAAVARQDLFAQIAGIGPESPIVDTGIGAKCATPGRRFGPAPTA